MNKVSESIVTIDRMVIPMADVQHIEKVYERCHPGSIKPKNIVKGISIIMKSTRWSFEQQEWENSIYLRKIYMEEFLKAWCFYRHELEGGKDGFKQPED